MRLQISKSVYIVEVEEDYGVDAHFVAYDNDNIIDAYSEFCKAEAEAVRIALELNEEIL